MRKFDENLDEVGMMANIDCMNGNYIRTINSTFDSIRILRQLQELISNNAFSLSHANKIWRRRTTVVYSKQINSMHARRDVFGPIPRSSR